MATTTAPDDECCSQAPDHADVVSDADECEQPAPPANAGATAASANTATAAAMKLLFIGSPSRGCCCRHGQSGHMETDHKSSLAMNLAIVKRNMTNEHGRETDVKDVTTW
jgi:hypothetical protein